MRERLPTGKFHLQIHGKAFLHLAANEVNEPQHVAAAGARMNENEIGVALADFRAADLGFREARLLDQAAGAEPARVLKDASSGLETERLRRLALDPRFP